MRYGGIFTVRYLTVVVFIMYIIFLVVWFKKTPPEQTNSSQTEKTTSISYELSYSCRSDMHLLGPHLKVISFSVYGTAKKFYQGLPEIIEAAEIFYPGWYIWIYSDELTNDLSEIINSYENVIWCNPYNVGVLRNRVNHLPYMWKYAPLGDPLVDVLLPRDSDAMIYEREAAAVYYWLEETNADLHIMRDLIYHDMQILGGLWGMRMNVSNRNSLENIRNKIFEEGKAYHSLVKGKDNILLEKFLWPNFVNSFVAHDSYNCIRYPGSQPFPTERKDSEYVGFSMYKSDNVRNQPKNQKLCPEKCRPVEHKDWVYC